MTADMTVAKTIVEQLGGRMFMMMTGVKTFSGEANAVSFKLGRNKTSANRVRIELTPADLYKVTFYRFSAKHLTKKDVEVSDNIHAEDLRHVFTDTTGLYTSL